MNHIYDILTKKYKSVKNLKIRIEKNKILLTKNFIYKIFIWEASKHNINLSYDWNFGILGKFILKRDFKEMNFLIKDIEDTLAKVDISVKHLIKNNI